MRPLLDDKSFAGGLFSAAELAKFQRGVARIAAEPGATLHPSDLVVVAAPKPIWAEFRLFVINGEVVTGSQYKVHDHLAVTAAMPDEVWTFARRCADRWNPNPAYALDIALTPTGLRALEINSANSAGFYAADLARFVAAVNQLEKR